MAQLYTQEKREYLGLNNLPFEKIAAKMCLFKYLSQSTRVQVQYAH